MCLILRRIIQYRCAISYKKYDLHERRCCTELEKRLQAKIEIVAQQTLYMAMYFMVKGISYQKKIAAISLTISLHGAVEEQIDLR